MENFEYILQNLHHNANVFQSLFENISEEQYLWKPSADSWCLLEVLCHLLDEERLDFRYRTEFILNNPGEIPPPFDPLVWVTEHEYLKKDYHPVLEEFLDERELSVNWLKSLDNPDWDLNFRHPKFGRMTAGYYLKNWLAHDYLHIRQINRLKYEFYNTLSDTDLSYAGKW